MPMCPVAKRREQLPPDCVFLPISGGSLLVSRHHAVFCPIPQDHVDVVQAVALGEAPLDALPSPVRDELKRHGFFDPPRQPTPTIEVRDAPPTAMPSETPASEQSAVELVQGEWTAAQVYDVAGEQVWVAGTLTIAGNVYTFAPTREVTGPSVSGTLDFLFEHPNGEVVIAGGGESAATCTFYADSTVVGEFIVEVGEDDTLRFHLSSGESDLWQVTRP